MKVKKPKTEEGFYLAVVRAIDDIHDQDIMEYQKKMKKMGKKANE